MRFLRKNENKLISEGRVFKEIQYPFPEASDINGLYTLFDVIQYTPLSIIILPLPCETQCVFNVLYAIQNSKK